MIVFSETLPDSVRKLTKKYVSDDSVTLNLLQGTSEEAAADADGNEDEEDEDEVTAPITVLSGIRFCSLAFRSKEERCSWSENRDRFEGLSPVETSSKGRSVAVGLW